MTAASTLTERVGYPTEPSIYATAVPAHGLAV